MKRLSHFIMALFVTLACFGSLSFTRDAYAVSKPASEIGSFRIRMNVDFGESTEADRVGKSLFVVINRSNGDTLIAAGKYPLVEYNNTTLSVPIVVDNNIYVNDDAYDENSHSYVTAFVADSSYVPSDSGNVIDSLWSASSGFNHREYGYTCSDGGFRSSSVVSSEFLTTEITATGLTYYGHHMEMSLDTPDSITSSNSDTAVEMVPMYSISQVQDKGNYVVVVRDKSDGKFYAMAPNSATGNRVLLSDVTSVDDLLNGYKFDTANDPYGVVLGASKTKHSETSTEAQLRTTLESTTPKKVWSLKMGTGASALDPLYDASQGTFMITYGSTTDASSAIRTFNILKSTYGSLRYASGFLGNSYFYGTSSDDYIYGSNGSYYLWYRRNSSDLYSSVPKVSYNEYVNNYHYSRSATLVNSEGITYMDNHPELLNGMFDKELYILTDVEDETVVDMETYTKYVTPGDFSRSTANYNNATPADSLIFVTEIDGKTYSMSPDGLVECVVRDGANGYDKVTLGASNAWTPNNYEGSYFNFSMQSYGPPVITSYAPIRASRQSAIGGNNYLMPDSSTVLGTWDGSTQYYQGVWTFLPVASMSTMEVVTNRGQSASYMLSYRDNTSGQMQYLGIENGQLILLTPPVIDSSMSEDERLAVYNEFMSKVAIFDVYGNKLNRYYPSSEDTEYRRYYRVYNLTDINEGDELLIGCRDSDNKLHLLTNAINSTYRDNNSNYWSSFYNYLPVVVLDGDSEMPAIDAASADSIVSTSSQYDTSTTQHPWAFFDETKDDVIWARGAVANGVGTAKKESSSQRKYEYVRGLGFDNTNVSIRVADTNYAYERLSAYTYKAREFNFFAGSDSGLFTLRGGKTNQWLVYDAVGSEIHVSSSTMWADTTNKYPYFTTQSTETPTEFEVYRRPMSDDTFTLVKHDVDGNEVSREERPQDSVSFSQEPDVVKDDTNYIFVGWTTNPQKAGYLSLADSANIFDYDDVAHVGSVKSELLSDRELIGRCDPDNNNLVSWRTISELCDTETVTTDDGEETKYTLNVYPVYAVKGFSQYALAKDGDINVMGIRDMKDAETGSLEPGESERWLGSIYLDVYVDGEPWVQSEPMYFAYHNDNAADINLKFIESGISEAVMNAYIGGDTFVATDPVGHRFIEAVWAEQGGSEDGLKARYNWMTSETGGQLDNVRGGSHVHVYLSTPYQVKYYFDDGSGDGYKQLPYGDNLSTDYTNNNYYVTKGSENAIASEEFSHRVVSDDDTSILLNKDTSSRQVYLDTDIVRGGYSKFLYPFLDHNDTFDVAALPTPPDNKSLDNTSWVLRGETAEATVAPSSQYTVTETTYGTGNSVYAYKSGQDSVNTYHLYARVKPNNGFVTIRKWFDMDPVMYEEGSVVTAGFVPAGIPVGGFAVTVVDIQDGIPVICWNGQRNNVTRWIDPCKTVFEKWRDSGQLSDDGIATIDGRYLIACDAYGDVGDYVDLHLVKGPVLKCIVADKINSLDDGRNRYDIDFMMTIDAFESGNTQPGVTSHLELADNFVTEWTNYGPKKS